MFSPVSVRMYLTLTVFKWFSRNLWDYELLLWEEFFQLWGSNFGFLL